MNIKTLFVLRKALEDGGLYSEALNVNYLIKYAAVDPIATSRSQSTSIPEGFFSPEDTDPEKYKEKLWRLYHKDIRAHHFDRLVKKFMKDGDSEEVAKDKAEKRVKQIVDDRTRKTMEGHTEFVKMLKNMNLPEGGKVLAPGSGVGHEQIIGPDINWIGLEYQQNLADMANQRNEQIGLPSRTRQWSLIKGDAQGKFLGENWEEEINKITDDDGDVVALYAKHACGGITDSAMRDAASEGIPNMLLATCCANRYTRLSWNILQPPVSFEKYEEIANESYGQGDAAKAAVDKIDGWREDFLKSRGYEVERGIATHGPYILAKKKS